MTPYYEHAGITIYHGDCREVLPGLTADVVIADPPYGVGFDYGTEWKDDEAFFVNVIQPAFVMMMAAAPLVFLHMSFRRMWEFPAPRWALCWAKPGSMRRSALGGFSEWEPILVYGKRMIANDLRVLPNCNNYANGGTGDHPCPKPLAVATWLVNVGTDPGQTILDPFVGSGTTLVAAKADGRKAIGIEIEERYCEIAANRLAQEVLAL